MGIKASNTAEVYFEDCPIPAENLLGGKIAFGQTENTRFSFPHGRDRIDGVMASMLDSCVVECG